MIKMGIAALLLPLALTAQQTRYVVKQNAMEYNIEKYYAYKTDTNFKHGSYKMINFFGGEPIKLGFYRNNKKDSTWSEFSTFGEIFVQATGNYRDDRKTGVWTYSDKLKSIEQKYDHSARKLVYYRPDETKYGIVTGRDTLLVVPDRPPVYVGGSMAIKSFIMTHLTYPPVAMSKGIQGTVIVAMLINADGRVGKIWIKNGVEKSLNEAAINVFKKLPAAWIPALYKGKPVASVYLHEIPFLLQ
jgi:protein TonB